MDRFATTLCTIRLRFNVLLDDFFKNEFVNLINPDRAFCSLGFGFSITAVVIGWRRLRLHL
jgi:hypothetical protein